MRVDVDKSFYHEADNAEVEFDRAELKWARYLLRRLRFLEMQVRESGGIAGGSGGAVHAELEMEALEWVLGEEGINYLGERGLRDPIRQTIGQT